MNYAYDGSTYSTRGEAHIACASGWISADGENPPEDILESLRRADSELADELEQTMETDDIDWYDREELLEAFRIVRQAPEKVFGWEIEDGDSFQLGDWQIYRDGQLFNFMHKDYDGGDEDYDVRTRDRRAGYSTTIGDCLDQIREIEEDDS